MQCNDDVVLRCRQWIHEKMDCCCVEYLSSQDLLKLGTALPIDFCPYATIGKKYKDMIHRHVAMLRDRPFANQLGEAADALVAWVDGTEVRDPPLDVSYCQFTGSCSDGPVAPVAPAGIQEAIASSMGLEGAVPLEPAVNEVLVGGVRGEQGQVSQRARYVHSMARALVELHALTWGQGLSIAESCWDRLAERHDIMIASECVDENDEAVEVIELDDHSERF